MRRCTSFLAVVALALATAGCDYLAPPKSPFHGVDVTGMEAGASLAGLTDASGKPRPLADFRGKVVVLMFGYTQCPDVCPTTLADYAAAMKQLGADAEKVQVLFVTVDPKRDTPELLREYVPAFDARFVGLRGDAQATANVAKDFHVYVQERPGNTPETYTVDHTSQVFVFDKQGKLRLMLPTGTPPPTIASDLRILLNS